MSTLKDKHDGRYASFKLNIAQFAIICGTNWITGDVEGLIVESGMKPQNA